MRVIAVFLILASFSFYILGCANKQDSAMQPEEAITMDTLTTYNTISGSVVAPVETQSVKAGTMQAAKADAQVKMDALPPAGPYKPTSKEIQTALKNAGYYTGPVDGKIGPLSKRAIQEFQKANSLDADGKVGPKTWAVLSKYLSSQPAVATGGSKR